VGFTEERKVLKGQGGQQATLQPRLQSGKRFLSQEVYSAREKGSSWSVKNGAVQKGEIKGKKVRGKRRKSTKRNVIQINVLYFHPLFSRRNPEGGPVIRAVL